MNPPIDFVSQNIIITFDIVSDMHQEIAMTSSSTKENQQEFPPSFGFVENTQSEKTRMSFSSCEQIWPTVEVSDYHLIFNLNDVLVVTGEGQIRSPLVVLRPSLKEFLSTCVKKFMVYIWSLAMKRNFWRHLDIIVEKTCILLPSSRILDQIFFFINDHFMLEKLDKLVFTKPKGFLSSFSWYDF